MFRLQKSQNIERQIQANLFEVCFEIVRSISTKSLFTAVVEKNLKRIGFKSFNIP